MKFIKIGNTILKKDRIISIRFENFENEKAKFKAIIEVCTDDNTYATFIDVDEKDIERITKEMLMD